MRYSNPLRFTTAAVAVLALAACDQATDPTGMGREFAPSFVTLPATPASGVLHVCKEFTGTESFDFDATLDDGNNATLHLPSFSLVDEECVLVASTPTVSGNFGLVTVTEDLAVPGNTSLAKIEVYTFNAANPGAGWVLTETILGTNSTQARFGNDLGRTLVFYNEPDAPPGDEGCTPGYWKNHTDSWPPTGFAPGDLASSVFTFGGLFPTLASKTLLASLGGGGGPEQLGAAKILLRAGTAALLNAAHPDVAYTQSEAAIIAAVNAALASNDRVTMLNLAAELDEDNNLGCPLN